MTCAHPGADHAARVGRARPATAATRARVAPLRTGRAELPACVADDLGIAEPVGSARAARRERRCVPRAGLSRQRCVESRAGDGVGHRLVIGHEADRTLMPDPLSPPHRRVESPGRSRCALRIGACRLSCTIEGEVVAIESATERSVPGTWASTTLPVVEVDAAGRRVAVDSGVRRRASARPPRGAGVRVQGRRVRRPDPARIVRVGTACRGRLPVSRHSSCGRYDPDIWNGFDGNDNGFYSRFSRAGTLRRRRVHRCSRRRDGSWYCTTCDEVGPHNPYGWHFTGRRGPFLYGDDDRPLPIDGGTSRATRGSGTSRRASTASRRCSGATTVGSWIRPASRVDGVSGRSSSAAAACTSRATHPRIERSGCRPLSPSRAVDRTAVEYVAAPPPWLVCGLLAGDQPLGLGVKLQQRVGAAAGRATIEATPGRGAAFLAGAVSGALGARAGRGARAGADLAHPGALRRSRCGSCSLRSCVGANVVTGACPLPQMRGRSAWRRSRAADCWRAALRCRARYRRDDLPPVLRAAFSWPVVGARPTECGRDDRRGRWLRRGGAIGMLAAVGARDRARFDVGLQRVVAPLQRGARERDRVGSRCPGSGMGSTGTNSAPRTTARRLAVAGPRSGPLAVRRPAVPVPARRRP